MQETGTHIPNLVIVQDVEGEERVFSGEKCNDEFCEWLFDDRREVDTMVISHNDDTFILRWLLLHGVKCVPLMNGGNIISLRVNNILFMDSLNYLPMALPRMPKMFGLTELKKGYLPHFFNTLSNQAFVGPLPDAHFYGPNGMYSEAQEGFLKWHAEQVASEVVFDFQKDLVEYCSDVDILRRCCL